MKGEGASASALGAKTARACDSCLRRRARWFCGADDAFLCHACDALVHSANQLASRHERVRLQTASAKVTTTASWHSGFTRKARTPRHNKQLQQRLKDQVIFNNTSSVLPLVPELGGEEQELVQLVDDELCRVPVFDVDDFDHAQKGAYLEEDVCDLESFSKFDVDLAEFAANVESLLGVNEDAAGQVLFDYKQEDVVTGQVFDCKEEAKEENSETVKVVKDEVEFDDLDSVFDLTNDEVVFHWNMYEDEDEMLHQEKQKQKQKQKQYVMVSTSTTNNSDVVVGVSSKEETKRERFLRLNYEDVVNAWASQGGSPSPWTTGNPPPNFSFDDDTWQSYCLGGSSGGADEVRSLRGQLMGMDGGREARVSRYREKRRTRLFAKKIRYEVRKLNAEKRPRMKGRFVKRTSLFAGSGSATDFQTNYH